MTVLGGLSGRIAADVSLCLNMVSIFFFNDTATTEIYTLSLHDALPISLMPGRIEGMISPAVRSASPAKNLRSEEHTSELQSPCNLVCRLLLEKKNSYRFDVPVRSYRP